MKRIFKKLVFIINLSIIFMLILPLLQDYADETSDYSHKSPKGVPASPFDTYITAKELVFSSSFGYGWNKKMEYNPDKLGYNQNANYYGKYKAGEGLLYLGYGISDRLLVEIQSLFIDAELHKARNDTSNMPAKIYASGLAGIQGQLRWLWLDEREKTPALFSYFKTDFPIRNRNPFIEMPDWNFASGLGVIKGFNWGTLAISSGLAYSGADHHISMDEYAIEYTKRIFDPFTIGMILEGKGKDLSLIPQLKYHNTNDTSSLGIGVDFSSGKH